MLKYKILALDHDDTVVKSTAEVHYPAFLETLKALRPEISMSLETFNEYCFSPGFFPLCREILKLTDKEMVLQDGIWKNYARTHRPSCFSGWKSVLRDYRANGGIVCVVSHSDREFILRDYETNFGFAPLAIFDWSLGEKKCKPYPYPIEEMCRRFAVTPHDILVVDDLTPGLKMARTAGSSFAYPAYANRLPEKTALMSAQSDYTLNSPLALNSIIYA